MGRFSELDILLSSLPHDREDSVYSKTSRAKTETKNYSPSQISIWGLPDEEIIVAIGATSPSDLHSSLIDRLIIEKKYEDIRPQVYQKKRG